MEISDCMWDEDFLCVDTLGDLEPSLGSTSLPSPNLAPFQWSLAPLADEADNSDMTPQCMPVIDPKFVRDHFIEDCVLDGVNDVMDSGADVLAGYLADQESSEQFATLHVLVCGFCHQVYHVVEEFKSHLMGCEGRSRNSEYTEYDTTSAVALVLWTNTVLRRVRESLSEMVHTVEMTSRIQARWWRLSRRSRQVWEKAAEVLRELAAVGSLVFPVSELRSETRIGDCVPDLRWPEPQDLFEADEIEMPGYIKTEESDEALHSPRLLSPRLPSPRLLSPRLPSPRPPDRRCSFDCQSEEELSVEVHPLPRQEISEPIEYNFHSSQSEDNPRLEETTQSEPNPSVKLQWKRQSRNRRGRWDCLIAPSTLVQENSFSCEPCKFKTDNCWKLERHFTTLKHKSAAGHTIQDPEVLNMQSQANLYVNNGLLSSKSWKDLPYTKSTAKQVSRKSRNTKCENVFSPRTVIKRQSAMTAAEKMHAWAHVLTSGKHS